MTSLESFFSKLEISDYYGHFLSKGINGVHNLRSLTKSEIMSITKDKKVSDKLVDAIASLPKGGRKDDRSNPKKEKPQGKMNKAPEGSQDPSWSVKGQRDKKPGNNAKLAASPQQEMLTPREENTEKTEEAAEGLTPTKPERRKTAERPKPDRLKNKDHSVDIELTNRIFEFLLSKGGHGVVFHEIGKVHNLNQTSNKNVHRDDGREDGTAQFTIWGSSPEQCNASKTAIEKLLGITRHKDEAAKRNYHMNKASMNARAMQYLLRENDKKETPLDDIVLQSIASYLSFEKASGIEHYTYYCKDDRVKESVLELLLEQLVGRVQMIVYCTAKQAPFLEARLKKRKPALNLVKPTTLIPVLKEERAEIGAEEVKKRRHDSLSSFKNGTAPPDSEGDDETVMQRLLIATDDYARYARSRDIPHVNFVVHFSPPRQRECSCFRSESVARGARGSDGAQVAAYELSLYSDFEIESITDLQQFVTLKKLPHEEEKEHFERWSRTIRPETKENPYVNYAKVEPLETAE